MPKNVWGNYATKTRLEQKGYFTKYPDRDACREAAKASNRHRNEFCRKEQEEKVDIQEQVQNDVCKVLNLNQDLLIKEMTKVKDGKVKKVLKHIQKDDKEFLKQIKDDKKLVKELKAKRK